MAEQTGFLRGAVFLSAAVTVTKILGAAYKIPLANALGAGGMAHFYVAYNVYNACLLLFTAGIPTVLSRQTACCRAMGQAAQERQNLKAALLLLTVFSLGSGAALFLCPDRFAAALHDPAAAASIRALALSLACMGPIAALRGYSQGRGDMKPTAVSQMLESLCKLLLGLALTAAALGQGAGEDRAAAAALWGVSFGSVAALLYLLARRPSFPSGRGTHVSFISSLSRLFQAGLPITASAAGMSLITLLDQTVFLHTLQSVLGYTPQAAAAAYGEYTFSATLFALPPGILMTLSASLIPAISRALAQHRERAASQNVHSALSFCALLAFPMGIGLSVMAQPLLHLLYPAQPQAAQAAVCHLQVLGVASIFVCLTALTNGILQAYRRERLGVLTLLCGGVVKIAATRILLSRPAIGIRGAAWGTLCCYALIFLLNVWMIARYTSARVSCFSAFLSPAAATVLMAMAAKSSYGWLSLRFSPVFSVLAAIVLAAAVYLLLLFSLGVFPASFSLSRLKNDHNLSLF